MPTEVITTQLRVLGARTYSLQMRGAVAATKELGTATIWAGGQMKTLGGGIDNLGRKIIGYGRNIGIAGAIGGAAIIKMGLQFDAGQERAQIGMKTLLGSAKDAKRTVTAVRDFALKAPLFGVEQMTNSAQQLIGAGYDAKKIVPYLRIFSDTISGMGRRPEDLQRMTYAFAQMMNKGQVSAEELRGQLGEIFPAQKLLAKEMGVTSQELAKSMKEGAIKGKKPIMMLLEAMRKRFGGATAQMAKTFDGQMANIKEQAKYMAGTLFQPLFKELEGYVFPLIGQFGTTFTDVLNDQTLTSKQKWSKIKDAFKVYFGPLANEYGAWIKKADLPGKLAGIFDTILPVMMNSAASAAPRVAGAFIDAWLHADAWTQVLTATLLLSKFGAFSKVGELVAGPFLTGFGRGMGGKKGQERIAKLGEKFGTKFGLVAGPFMVLALLPFMTEMAKKVRDLLNKLAHKKYDPKETRPPYDPSKPNAVVGPSFGDIWAWIRDKSKGHKKKSGWSIFGLPLGAKGGSIGANKPMVVGEEGPELFQPGVSGTIIPNSKMAMPSIGGGEIVIHNYMQVDRQTLARAVTRHQTDYMARR